MHYKNGISMRGRHTAKVNIAAGFQTLRKHAYSNILKFLPPKKMKIFRKKKSYMFHMSAQKRLWVLVRTASAQNINCAHVRTASSRRF